ncbi:conserved hypothetical protein [Ricinus communis]|uniref:DUF4283 domain-containing protein n=1 Tax=Ricinus communis TaxID=3988 RepID=B9S546_RICCO|nr:conserved hypothetical protein [Ricinus communis]
MESESSEMSTFNGIDGVPCKGPSLALIDHDVKMEDIKFKTVGRIITERNFIMNMVKESFKSSCGPEVSFTISKEKHNVYIFTFKEEELNTMLREGPWSTVNAHIVLKEWPLDEVVGLPPGQLNVVNAKSIGAIFDGLEDVDKDRLLDFCLAYGKLGDLVRGCKKVKKDLSNHDFSTYKWKLGNWLKATMPYARLRKRQVDLEKGKELAMAIEGLKIRDIQRNGKERRFPTAREKIIITGPCSDTEKSSCSMRQSAKERSCEVSKETSKSQPRTGLSDTSSQEYLFKVDFEQYVKEGWLDKSDDKVTSFSENISEMQSPLETLVLLSAQLLEPLHNQVPLDISCSDRNDVSITSSAEKEEQPRNVSSTQIFLEDSSRGRWKIRVRAGQTSSSRVSIVEIVDVEDISGDVGKSKNEVGPSFAGKAKGRVGLLVGSGYCGKGARQFSSFHTHEMYDDGGYLVATFLYEDPDRRFKNSMWDEIGRLKPQDDGPWLCAGDSNMVSSLTDNVGRIPVCSCLLHQYHDFMDGNLLMEVAFKGPSLTGPNNWVGSEAMAARLDKVLVNPQWKLLFDKALIIYEALIESNHWPLILDLCVQARRYRRVLHFESKWFLNPNCSDLIAKSWEKDDHGKLQACKKALMSWDRKVFRKNLQLEETD